ncbi:pyroglutamyl-peptidase I [Bifidobacterium avesanii]|uniref:Pyrrolidone-carboxylate peptidase n=1 Tax=Bifidobacterium avesanii TaxID=1798157 RepID=A0A7K3THC8_9BIFI|nr:pyroglutamyl-peptidase I [Bifidobacterium avesanii]KAB8292858.1 pyrrolidone-carboxylate peptidase [Bifidobacterium avesanii]NEG78462.1 pyroglutamyl-peptidase I [Bifidobacterium avesanii]
MTTVLITGFDPFGGEKVNPAFESVKLLPSAIVGARIVKLEVPTAYARSAAVLEEAIERERPDAVICVGQAGGRSALTVERVAINLAEASIPDNDGDQPVDRPLREDGDAAYFASVPVKAMIRGIRDHGLPAFVSYTAGTFVCNAIMYNLLYLIDHRFPGVKGGFIHVPYEPGQVVGKPNGTPSMPLATIAKGLEAAVEAAVKDISDGGAGSGGIKSGDPAGAMGEIH